MHSTGGCTKLGFGPRAVPSRSGPNCLPRFWFSEHPGVFPRATSRDGSRSGELDAALLNTQRWFGLSRRGLLSFHFNLHLTVFRSEEHTSELQSLMRLACR